MLRDSIGDPAADRRQAALYLDGLDARSRRPVERRAAGRTRKKLLMLVYLSVLYVFLGDETTIWPDNAVLDAGLP